MIQGWIAYEGLVANPIFYLILMSGAYTTGSRLMGYAEPPSEYQRLNSSEQVRDNYTTERGSFSLNMVICRCCLSR